MFVSAAGQAAAISQVASLTLEDVQAALEQPQNPEPPIPEFISAITTQAARASNLPASLEASSPLKKSAASQQQQENSGPQTSGEEDDIAKKTRRIASKLHIMASKKQLDPAVRRRSQPLAALLVLKRIFSHFFLLCLQKVSDEEARALIDLQLKTNAPLLPPWYRHAQR